MSLPEATETGRPGAISIESRSKAWVEILVGTSAELERLNRDTEQEFFKIGDEVTGFLETVNLMSSGLTSLAESVSERHGQRAAEALTGVLNQSTQMRGRSEEGGRLLGTMRQEAGSLTRALSHFSGTVATFHSLGLLTRIETARLGNASADFGNLAEEVRLLARNVQSRVESALDTAGELTPRIESALQEVSALQDGQAKNLPLIILQVSESLSSFREMQSGARDASIRLAAEYGEISEAFKRMIVSMQFNDITRQQVEHVIAVLRRLITETREEDDRLLLESPGAAAVLELQSLQLANANNKFSTSVASVAESLDEIGANVVKMVEEGGELSSLSGKSSTLRQMERGCSAILSGLGQWASADAATFKTSEGLAEKIDRMRASIEEIRAIEMQMRRIAMNARISAEHLGPSGEALSALADSIKERALESRQGSDSLVETLYLISEAVSGLSAYAQPGASEQEAQAEGLERMRIAVVDLRSSREGSAGQIGQIIVRGDLLCKGIRAARASFSVGVRFADAVSQTQERLKAIIEEVESVGFGENDGAPALSLATFARHYTMQDERDIYNSANKTATLRGEDGPSISANRDADALGDNIELF